MENTWLCLQTAPKREYELARALVGIGVSAYAPRYQKRHVTKYFNRLDPAALFPSYLFASVDYLENKSLIQRFPLKLRSYVVGEIGNSIIEEIQARQVGEFVILDEKKIIIADCPFQKDDPVKMRRGELSGVFDSVLSDGERAIILTRLFNQEKQTLVYVRDLEFAVA